MLKVKVLSKQVTVEKDGKKKSFLRYFTHVKMVVKGEEEKGKQLKSLTVKFTEDVSKQLPKGARFFYLGLEKPLEQLSCPRVYEVKIEQDKDGNEIKKFPVVWIRGYDKYEDIPMKPITDDVDFETEDVTTEETEINISSDEFHEEE